MEFVNEGDMEELFRLIDDGKVHHAGEVRTPFRKFLLSDRGLIDLF